ncbi:hypothetical protein ACQEVX_00890 [Streptomyces syringium]|uniref:hypothetical protein n=1 Tax=Streptomyces syringium TaxID=76729 RepID=UPI003D8C2020
MTAAQDRLDSPRPPTPPRRVIAALTALTALIGACAEAAGAVYQPIAVAARPGREAVEVDFLPGVQVSLAAAALLDLAAPRALPGG